LSEMRAGIWKTFGFTLPEDPSGLGRMIADKGGRKKNKVNMRKACSV